MEVVVVVGAPELQSLMDRVQRGDREAVASLLIAYKPLIKRRLRLRMGSAIRDVADSEDVWSTMVRRLDAFVEGRPTGIADQKAFWRLVTTIARHSIVDQARVLARTKRAVQEDQPFALVLAERLGERPPEVAEAWLSEVLDSAGDGIDQDIVRGWLLDRTHREIAEAVGLSEGAVRFRWHKIRHRLKVVMEAKPWTD